MFRTILILNPLFLGLAAAKNFTNTCDEAHIVNRSTFLNAICDRADRTKSDTSIDLKICLPQVGIVGHELVPWEFCDYTEPIATCEAGNLDPFDFNLGGSCLSFNAGP
jgi:hypothetical protein